MGMGMRVAVSPKHLTGSYNDKSKPYQTSK